MHFDVFTLFPELFAGVFDASMIKRAREANLIEIALHDIRAYTTDRHHVTDDYTYGGGGGMVMKPEPIVTAVESVLGAPPAATVVLLSPQGRLFTQAVAQELAGHARLALICGHYEGVDDRVREILNADEISIGDYVLTGGEIPAMIVVDAVSRYVPGVVGQPAAPHQDSHATGLLEHPQYTRPVEFRGHKVPDEVLSGNHGELARWRRRQALKRTLERRPDLLARADLTETDRQFLQSLGWKMPEEPAGE
jgi:tRNA (guanine37-N1)-methyltransferase